MWVQALCIFHWRPCGPAGERRAYSCSRELSSHRPPRINSWTSRTCNLYTVFKTAKTQGHPLCFPGYKRHADASKFSVKIHTLLLVAVLLQRRKFPTNVHFSKMCWLISLPILKIYVALTAKNCLKKSMRAVSAHLSNSAIIHILAFEMATFKILTPISELSDPSPNQNFSSYRGHRVVPLSMYPAFSSRA